MSEYEGAYMAYKKAYELEPTDVIKQSLAIADKKFREHRSSSSFSHPPNQQGHSHNSNNNNYDQQQHGHSHDQQQQQQQHGHSHNNSSPLAFFFKF